MSYSIWYISIMGMKSSLGNVIAKTAVMLMTSAKYAEIISFFYSYCYLGVLLVPLRIDG